MTTMRRLERPYLQSMHRLSPFFDYRVVNTDPSLLKASVMEQRLKRISDVEPIRRNLNSLQRRLPRSSSSSIFRDLYRSLSLLDTNLGQAFYTATPEIHGAIKQEWNDDVLGVLFGSIIATLDGINMCLQELAHVGTITRHSTSSEREVVEEIDSRLEELGNALEHFTHGSHFFVLSIKRRKLEFHSLDVKHAKSRESVTATCNRMFTGIQPAYCQTARCLEAFDSTQGNKIAGACIQGQLKQNFDKSIAPYEWNFGIIHCIHWLETARWLKTRCKPKDTSHQDIFLRPTAFGPQNYCLLHLVKAAYILLRIESHEKYQYKSLEMYDLVHTLYIAIQEELHNLYTSFFMDMDYSAFLTMTMLFDMAIPVSWAHYVLPVLPDGILQQRHISIESSLSGGCSSSSSNASQNTLSPTTNSPSAVPLQRPEHKLADKIIASEPTHLHIQVDKTSEEPNLETTQSENVVLNRENGQEWFTSAEFRMSSNVDQDKWEKCRLKILRNSSSSMAPYIRINIVRQNGESTDEIVEINTTELIPSFQFPQYNEHEVGDILLYSLTTAHRLDFRFDRTDLEALEVYGFQGAVTNTQFEAEYVVEATHFKPKNHAADAVYASEIKFQIWDDAPASLESFDGDSSHSPKSVGSAKQPETNVAMEDGRFLRLIFFIQNRIYLIYISDKVGATVPIKLRGRRDSTSNTMAMMMPTTEDFNRSLRVRCISGRINGGPGIPLNFDGCHFKDQYEDKLFKKYDSVRLNFYDQPTRDDFILTFNRLVAKWKNRRRNVNTYKTKRTEEQHNIMVKTKAKVVLE